MFVDTTARVYAADQDVPAHARRVGRVDGWRRQASAWYPTWPIVYEFLRVTAYPRLYRTPWPVGRAWQSVEALLAVPGLGVLAQTTRHADVAAEVIAELPFLAGNLVHGAHTAVLMREHGLRRVYARDTDFHRFPFVEPIDPLAKS